MMKNKSRKNILQLFVLFLLAISVITFSACRNDTNNTPNNTSEDIEADDTNEILKEPSTSPDITIDLPDNSTKIDDTEEPIQLVGFVNSINEANKTIFFDEIEWVTSEDKDKISELGLSEDDLSTGYYIYNPDESLKSITYTSLGNIVLYERSEEVKQITVTINELKELLEQHPILCKIVLEDNVIKSINEIYLP